MDTHLEAALQALKTQNTNAGLTELVMAFQEMSCRLDEIEKKVGGRFDGNILRDGTGKIVAKHDKWDDRTRDRNGRIVGNGEQRLRQLGKDEGPK